MIIGDIKAVIDIIRNAHDDAGAVREARATLMEKLQSCYRQLDDLDEGELLAEMSAVQALGVAMREDNFDQYPGADFYQDVSGAMEQLRRQTGAHGDDLPSEDLPVAYVRAVARARASFRETVRDVLGSVIVRA